MIVLGLAVRDLIRDRFFFLCNVAVIVGVLAPLLVLFGVKNGVYQALIGEMMANPATLQIDTLGNNDLGRMSFSSRPRYEASSTMCTFMCLRHGNGVKRY